MSKSGTRGNDPQRSIGDDSPHEVDDDNEACKTLIALRKKCPRFRILIIGKANAGKTTILQKMCNTPDTPIIHDQHGNLVEPSVVAPTADRGLHDINYELTFSNNPNFVFHDSCGYEANSTEETTRVRNFIAERMASNDLPSQLHAIWYCLPTDNDRPLSKAEMTLFETGTGNVPVIAIFTKLDGLETREFAKLRAGGMSIWEAQKLAPELARRRITESDYYLKKLERSNHPPAGYLWLGDMHKETSTCADLTEQTMKALDGRTLQFLFVSVQQNNIQLCTKFAVKDFLMPRLIKSVLHSVHLGGDQMKNITTRLLLYFPHFWDLSYVCS